LFVQAKRAIDEVCLHLRDIPQSSQTRYAAESEAPY
jgi:hypothetical protein